MPAPAIREKVCVLEPEGVQAMDHEREAPQETPVSEQVPTDAAGQTEDAPGALTDAALDDVTGGAGPHAAYGAATMGKWRGA